MPSGYPRGLLLSKLCHDLDSLEIASMRLLSWSRLVRGAWVGDCEGHSKAVMEAYRGVEAGMGGQLTFAGTSMSLPKYISFYLR
jgi:hypothetical protein